MPRGSVSNRGFSDPLVGQPCHMQRGVGYRPGGATMRYASAVCGPFLRALVASMPTALVVTGQTGEQGDGPHDADRKRKRH